MKNMSGVIKSACILARSVVAALVLMGMRRIRAGMGTMERYMDKNYNLKA